MKIGLLLLAAGESSRLGQPKQLLPFRGRPLLGHLVETATASQCFASIVVVLGAFATRIRAELGSLSATIVVNRDWKKGMGSSLQRGLKEIDDHDAAAIMLCDQPFVSAALLRRLVAAHRGGITACAYRDTLGPPALFDASFFPELRALPPDAGAKTVLVRHASTVRRVPFPRGARDIDTPDDWKKIAIASRRCH
ncbi:MAG TPA: nucleotidyltransferase family protein [Verrucomicrobiae bacterium]|nr:nucleotidyltransferase family protein [Verrucomicrobiae bacterium]